MCCGKKRRSLVVGRPAGHPSAPKGQVRPRALKRLGVVYFRYVGQTGLLVKGGKTGKRYRFSHPGAVVAVDPGDRRSLLTVHNLRQVRSP